jgi:hypothetical protein
LLELGKRLVSELGLDETADTLGRWMAHYLAELIHSAETATGEEQPAKLQTCCEAILSIWRHRRELPNGKRPFEEIEPILKALESLDPNNETPRYLLIARTPVKDTGQKVGAKNWLELANEVDYSAKILIRYCLSQAAKAPLDKSKEWLALAEAAELDNGVEVPVLHIIIDEKKLLEDPDPNEPTRKTLEYRIKRLEGLRKLADELVTALEKQLKQLGPRKATS